MLSLRSEQIDVLARAHRKRRGKTPMIQTPTANPEVSGVQRPSGTLSLRPVQAEALSRLGALRSVAGVVQAGTDEKATPATARRAVAGLPGKIGTIRLRREQYAAVRVIVTAAPRARIVAALQSRLPEQCEQLKPAALNALCDRAIVSADQRGMGSERGCYVFAAAMLLYGTDFYRRKELAWPAQLFGDDRLDGESRTQLLALRIFLDTAEEI